MEFPKFYWQPNGDVVNSYLFCFFNIPFSLRLIAKNGEMKTNK